MIREMMAITGLSAQELVRIARSAFGPHGALFGALGGTASAAVSDSRAAAMGIFRNDGVTGNGMGMKLLGKFPLLV